MALLIFGTIFELLMDMGAQRLSISQEYSQHKKEEWAYLAVMTIIFTLCFSALMLMNKPPQYHNEFEPQQIKALGESHSHHQKSSPVLGY